jgi:hypothetical protein
MALLAVPQLALDIEDRARATSGAPLWRRPSRKGH